MVFEIHANWRLFDNYIFIDKAKKSTFLLIKIRSIRNQSAIAIWHSCCLSMQHILSITEKIQLLSIQRVSWLLKTIAIQKPHIVLDESKGKPEIGIVVVCRGNSFSVPRLHKIVCIIYKLNYQHWLDIQQHWYWSGFSIFDDYKTAAISMRKTNFCPITSKLYAYHSWLNYFFWFPFSFENMAGEHNDNENSGRGGMLSFSQLTAHADVSSHIESHIPNVRRRPMQSTRWDVIQNPQES